MDILYSAPLAQTKNKTSANSSVKYMQRDVAPVCRTGLCLAASASFGNRAVKRVNTPQKMIRGTAVLKDTAPDVRLLCAANDNRPIPSLAKATRTWGQRNFVTASFRSISYE